MWTPHLVSISAGALVLIDIDLFELSLLSELCVGSSGALQPDMGAVFQPDAADAQGQRVRSTP
jgi:hypothetical protein